MKVLGIIPARYGSSRLEGKPLKDIVGKTMIQRVYEQSSKALEHVIVATDDQRIYDTVKSFGGEVVMTGKHHNTGTNRCLEALEIYRSEYNLHPEVVINIQGDEPLLQPEQIDKILSCFTDPNVELASLAMPINPEDVLAEKNGCFVVMTKKQDALYFSRSIIPFYRDLPQGEWPKNHTYYSHLGMYAYTPKALKRFAEMEQTSLEKAESLEQNRWLENGYAIRLAITEFDTIAVDTAEDLQKVREIIENEKS